MPPKRRERPASSAAIENVDHESRTSRDGVIPGSTFELPFKILTESPKLSLPVNRKKIWAAAALNVLWPETYSGNGGVMTISRWKGIHVPPSIDLVPRPGPAHAWICFPA